METKDFQGVYPYDKLEMNRLCHLFEVALHIHTPKKSVNGKTHAIYRCTTAGAKIYQNTKLEYTDVDLFFYQNIYSVITDINKFNGEFDCEKCQTYYTSPRNLTNHIKQVHTVNKYVKNRKPKSGVFQPKYYFKEKLKNQGIPEELLQNVQYKHFCVFDIEASLLEKHMDEELFEEDTSGTKNSYLLQKHQTMCIAIASTFSKTKIFNLKTYDCKGSAELIFRFISYALKLSRRAKKIYLENNNELIRYLENIKKECLLNDKKSRIQQIDKLLKKINNYAKSMPILGYNSARYDLQVLRYDGFFNILNQLDTPIVLIRKGGFMRISTPHFLWLDAIKFISGGYNLRAFVKAFAPRVKIQKSYFPYEAINDLKKLTNDYFPPYHLFESKLKGCNTLEEENNTYFALLKTGYSSLEACQELKIKKPPMNGYTIYKNLHKTWKKKNMKTWRDYLNYYIYLDVVPFKKAVENLLSYFHEKNVDIFKSHCSISSAAVNMLFLSVKNPIENSFYYLDPENYEHIRRTIQGGLVLNSQRLFDCSAGMLIKEYKYKELAIPGEIIASYDCNTLYGGILGASSHLTGPYVERDLENKYAMKWCYENAKTNGVSNTGCFTWLTYRALSYQNEHGEFLFIRSTYNQGEKYFLTKQGHKYRVDGFAAKQPHNGRAAIFEYLGCLYHAHERGVCLKDGYIPEDFHPLKRDSVGKKVKNKTILFETMKRLDEIRSSGCEICYIWECQWEEFLKNNIQTRNTLNNYLIPSISETEYITQESEMLEAIKAEKVYGIIFCSIAVPEHLQDTVFEYPPVFKKIENFNIDKLPDGSYLKNYCIKYGLTPNKNFLTSLLAGDNLVLPSEYVKHMLSKDYIVRNVCRVLQFGSACVKPFKNFVDQIINERRRGAAEGNTIVASMSKMILNASVGFTLMKSNTLPQTKICDEQRSKKIRRLNPNVSSVEFLGPTKDVKEFFGEQELNDLFLIVTEKNNPAPISNMPVLLGWKVLAMAKLKMLQFMEEMRYYLDDAKWSFLYSDTDSLVCVFADKNIDNCVKDCYKTEWLTKKREIFVTNEPIICDNFTPLRLKIEAVGDKFACISAKMYCIAGTNSEIIKSAQKGVKIALNRDLVTYEKYKRIILELGEPPEKSKYVGFLSSYKDDGFWTVQMEKQAFTGLYFKRLVLENGYWTQPLDWKNE